MRRSASSAGPAWRIVAWVVAGVGWATAAAAVTLLVVTGHPPSVVADWVMDVVVAALYGVVVVVMLPRVRNAVVWVLALTAWGCAVAALAEQYAALDGGRAGQGVAFYAMWWSWSPGLYATVAVMPFLVVRLPSRVGRIVVALGSAVIVMAVVPPMTVVADGLPHNPLGVDHAGWQQAIRALGSWPDRAVTLIGAGAAGWIAYQRRRLPRAERTGLTWLLCGQVLLVAAMVLFLWPFPGTWQAAAAEVSGSVLLLAQAFLPAALLVLVLGRQMWGVDATVSRTTTWSVMTVCVAFAYLLVVALATTTLPHASPLVLALVAGVLALGFTPLRALVQRRVDVLVYGTAADPARLWSTLGGSTSYDMAELAESLRAGLRLSAVDIVAADPTGEVPAVTAREGERAVSLVSRGSLVGVLLARPRTGERLDRRTLALLEQVAGLLATTLDLLRSNEALAAARSRLVSIRHEERRVLRRDLHDGLGPALAGIRFGLSASRNLREQDPAAADELLDELQRELKRRGEDIRQLSRTLLPPTLDDGDLRAALGGLAARFSGSGLDVTVELADDLETDETTQIALYHIAAEGLLNTHRHAHARHAAVVVRGRADGGVLLVVTDDGTGMEAAGSEGVGLRSMRERAQELGGTLEITRAAANGGTRLAVRLPPTRVGSA